MQIPKSTSKVNINRKSQPGYIAHHLPQQSSQCSYGEVGHRPGCNHHRCPTEWVESRERGQVLVELFSLSLANVLLDSLKS